MTRHSHEHVPVTGEEYGRIAEIVPGQLFFASYENPPSSNASVRYMSIDEKVHYDPFYSDFGPLNISVVHRFTQHLHGILETITRRKIICYTDSCDQNRVNGAFLMGAYLIIYHSYRADIAYLRVRAAEPPSFIAFRDAAMAPSTWELHLHDALRGVEKGMHFKWFDVQTFDPEEYEFYEKVENGDFNWIIPGKILSFCGPHEKSIVENGYPYHAPEVYFDYFKEHGISTIVRLNMRMYDAKRFTDAGFDHVDLFFIDGSTPSDEIVKKFIKIVDKARGGVAIHCKAGLGRTGTLIACWMMKEFGMTAPECIAWLRICRPGSVIGPQQQFLINKQQLCWSLKRSTLNSPPTRPVTVSRLVNKVDDINIRQEAKRPETLPLRKKKQITGNINSNINAEEFVDSEGRSQGDRLLEIKARGQCVKRIAALTQFTSPTTPIKPLSNSPHIDRPRAARNLMQNIPPISRVTVTSARPSTSKTTKRGTNSLRQQPYPSSFLKVEMPASNYQLRPRNSNSPRACELGKTLSPNSEALGGISPRIKIAKKTPTHNYLT